MTTKQALSIVLRAASANASGSDNAAEIMQAVRLVQQFPAPKAKLTLTRKQADRLLCAIAAAVHYSLPEASKVALMEEYTNLAEAYAAAGYDVEGLKDE